MQLPALCHPRFTSLQAQHEEGKALETFVQSVVLKCVPCVRTPRRRRQRELRPSVRNRTPTPLTQTNIPNTQQPPKRPRCGVVRREDLCIAEGRHVWKLNVDVHCLSHEGSLPDACALAAVAALADVKLPGTVITKDDEVLVAPGAILGVEWMGVWNDDD